MADNSKIEWTDATWNPIAGCDIASPGCRECYAMRRVAPRLAANPKTPHYHGTVVKTKTGYVWTGKIGIASDKVLTQPLHWKRPRKIFVNSTSDLFHPGVPDEVIDRVFAIMALCPLHIFQVLTKRPGRMLSYLSDDDQMQEMAETAFELACTERNASVQNLYTPSREEDFPHFINWPLPNVLLGVSVEDQPRADERQEHMRNIAAAGWATFVSYEPALGPADWQEWDFIKWMISGGETGARSRPSHPDWHRATRDFCEANSIPYHFKQWGDWYPVNDDELPENFGKDCDLFRSMCSNGFVGPLSLESIFLHRPRSWPQCFPNGKDGDANCISATLKRVGKKHAGRLLDGVEYNGFPKVGA